MSSWPTITCEIAFAANASSDPTAGQWVNVSSYLRSFSTKRGRNRDLDQIEAGRATIVLRNPDRRFDPENTASPYYPNVLPMRHVRLRANGIDVWRGFIDGWPQKWPGRTVANQGEAIVEVTATDAFKIFNNIELPESLWEMEIPGVPQTWWRFGESAGDTALLDSAGGYVGAIQGSPSLGVEGLVAFDDDAAISFNGGVSHPDIVRLPAAAGIVTSQYTILFLMKRSLSSTSEFAYGQMGSSLGSDGGLNNITVFLGGGGGAVGFIDRPIGGTGISIWSVTRVDDDRPHFIALRRDATTQKVYVDGNENASIAQPSTGTHDSFSVVLGNDQTPSASEQWQGTLDEFITIPSALPPADIAKYSAAALTPFAGKRTDEAITRILDYINWPAALRSLATGISTLQGTSTGGSALEFMQKITTTENGVLFVDPAGIVRFRNRHAPLTAPGNVVQATFGDDTTELPYAELVFEHDDANIFNEARVGRTGGSAVTVRDTASIAAYQTRTYEKTDLATSNDLEVIDHANWIVSRKKDPRTEVRSMVIRPESRAALMTQVLTREIGDLVTVNRRPPGGGAIISKNVRIEGIEHSVERRQWKTTYWLSGVLATDQSWILGDSTYGKLDQTARLGF